MSELRLEQDDFHWMGLPRQFRIDIDGMAKRRQDLLASVHPDRFVTEGAAAQRVAMQWSVRVTEAWQRLKDPLTRAAYLCELAGQSVDADRNTAMPADFLVQQMQWREAMADAQGPQPLKALLAEVGQWEQEAEAKLHDWLDGTPSRHDLAADWVRRWMFVRKFRAQLEDRLFDEDC